MNQDPRTNKESQTTGPKFSSLQQKVDYALVDYLYRQGPAGLIATAFCATILLVGLYHPSNAYLVIGWYVIFLLILAARYILLRTYLKDPLPEKNIAYWRRLFTIGACAAGCCWGFPSLVLLPSMNSMQLTLLIFILAGMSAGAVPLLSAVLSTAIAFLIPTVLPLIIGLLFLGNPTYILFDVTVFVYLCYLISLSNKSHRMLANAFSFQFENDLLLNNLSDAKEQLELSNKMLAHSATHDPLTDLSNRSLFEEKFNEAIKEAEKGQKIFALLYIDIDKFKEANDAYGHSVGDLLLQKIVERIKQKLPLTVISSRLGGDEFTVIIKDVTDVDKVEELARQLCSVLTKPFAIKDYNLIVSVSIGIAIYPFDGRDTNSLLKNADRAMYRAKDLGGNTVCFNTDLTVIRASDLRFAKDF